MSSELQIEANRRNSLLSTGPRTPEGKAVSRFNALKSGIHAKSQVVPGEDPAELEALTDGYHQDWAPASHLECFLVDSLIRADWLLRRLARIEAETWTHEVQDARKSTFSKLDEEAPLGHIYGRTDERYTRLQRRMDSTERSYYHALTQLQRLRAGERPAPDERDYGETKPLPPSPPQPAEPDPGERSASDQTNPISSPFPELPPAASHGTPRRCAIRESAAYDCSLKARVAPFKTTHAVPVVTCVFGANRNVSRANWSRPWCARPLPVARGRR